ncbi:MAG TPA: translesion DNA synthesis-associated protein ImuA [Steroidobacter sp.]|jgi:hypothetical protein|nr:translesion DNA synthesis-associated protein ImuA [Steroidobacteraceae bacterium]HLS81651.1 translesion DNA synthesis-associated protein ImuA [Steroidobacter sp.]
MDRAATLQQLAWLCRGDALDDPSAIWPSGVQALDAALPGGGWRSGGLVEVMTTQTGIGEMRLVTPALAQLTRADRYVAFVSPPFVPFAPALIQQGVRLERLLIVRAQRRRDVLWSLEQTLRCRSFGAVLGWPETLHDRDVRRLQLAAEAGGAVGFLYRPAAAARAASPAAVRLVLRAQPDGRLNIEILKCRGGRSGLTITVERSSVASSSIAKTASAASS